MECLDKNVFIKVLKHTVVYFWIFGILLCGNLSASQSIDQIPGLVVNVSTSSVSIPKQFLDLCQWVMKSNVLEGQIQQQVDLQFPQNFESSKALLKQIASGRNIMLTKIDDVPVMVLTGIGPACNSQQKATLETASGIKIIDVVEILPCEDEERCKIRDVMFKMVSLSDLANKLFQYLDEARRETFKVNSLLVLRRDIRQLGRLPDPLTSKSFEFISNAIDTILNNVSKTNYTNSLDSLNMKNFLDAINIFQNQYKEIKDYYNEYLKMYFT